MGVLSPEQREQAGGIIARYPEGHERSAMMPLLYLVQSVEGYLSREGMREVAEILGLRTAEVEAVASFYTMLRRHSPGDHVISVCTNLSCALRGANELYAKAKEIVEPDDEGVSSDGKLTVHEEECLGGCDGAPVVQVNFANYDNMTEEKLAELIEAVRRGELPAPSRGTTPKDIRDASRTLAGLGGEQ
ncbi:MAG: NADH-quinone oxidoreductase subunit NuoE [Actinomycetota bacterium]